MLELIPEFQIQPEVLVLLEKILVDVNIIEYFALTSTGHGIDFGDLTKDRTGPFAVSNSTRGVYGGGRDSSPSITNGDIEFITLSTLGNGADFGDLDQSATDFCNGNISNSVRGLVCGGYNHPSPTTFYDYIQYITIPTLGNATDFGDLTEQEGMVVVRASPTRGVCLVEQDPSQVKYLILLIMFNS